MIGRLTEQICRLQRKLCQLAGPGSLLTTSRCQVGTSGNLLTIPGSLLTTPRLQVAASGSPITISGSLLTTRGRLPTAAFAYLTSKFFDLTLNSCRLPAPTGILSLTYSTLAAYSQRFSARDHNKASVKRSYAPWPGTGDVSLPGTTHTLPAYSVCPGQRLLQYR